MNRFTSFRRILSQRPFSGTALGYAPLDQVRRGYNHTPVAEGEFRSLQVRESIKKKVRESGPDCFNRTSKRLILKDWLGGLDSNQDSQIQNLKSCQLDDLPAACA